MHFATPFPIFLTLSVTLSGVSAYPRHDSRALVCYENNALRALERFSSVAATFCPKYLSATAVAVPTQFADVQKTAISSACSCFEKTAGTLSPTVATPSATSLTRTPTTSATSTKKTSSSTSASSSSTSTVPTVVATGGSTGGKRGLVYDYTSKTAYGNMFIGASQISFGSNWNSQRAIGSSITLDNSFAFVPTLRVDASLSNNNWVTDATNAINSGSKYLFSSNEPDNAGQANLSVQQAVQVYQKYMNQFQGKVKLATPAVTNGGGSTGLNYLGQFVDACSGCHFDIINIHHYVPRSDLTVDQAVSALKSYIENDVPALQAKHTQLQGLPIMIGEFFLTGASEAEGGEYLQKIMPYLDQKSTVIGYQAFGGLWPGSFISDNGNGLSPAGAAYKNN
ncbi:MAG: hypothetical protein Q9195_001082 [Heterodermia aff. obscurata]